MSLLCLKNNDIDTFYAYNLTLKKYADNLVKCKKTSFANIKGFYTDNQHKGTMTDDELEEKSRKYLKKVKTNIIDLAYNNKEKFEYFITLTFDMKDNYSHERVVEELTKWIDNQKHQNKYMSYILVPEFHKSGRLHFHGLVGNVPKWKLKKAINAKTGKPMLINNTQIYNLENYKIGFTTISKIKSKEKVTNYISKYATKELITLKSKKRYWYSRDLKKPVQELDYIDLSLAEYFKDQEVVYNDIFSTENRDIELLNYQLPIIDIMLTSIYIVFICVYFIYFYYLQ